MSLTTRRTRTRSAVLLSLMTAVPVLLAAAPASAANFSQMQNKERPWGGTICLEIDYGRAAAGDDATVEWCSQNGQHQQWQLVENPGSEYVQLRVAHDGMCLTVEGGSHADGTQVEQQPCTNALNQQWKFVYKKTANGLRYHEVVARHSAKCLDKVWTWNVTQYNCHGGDNQLWTQPVWA